MSDYTRLVARGLAAAGDEVGVFAPLRRDEEYPNDPEIVVRRLVGCYGPRSLMQLEHWLSRPPKPDRILVQYVPHAFGFKAMNLAFAAWLAYRSRKFAPVWVMFHEVSFPLRWWPLKHGLLGVVTRLMARLIATTADRIFVSVPAWGRLLEKVCPRLHAPEWLPVPCNVSTMPLSEAVAAARSRFALPSEFLVGHFGTYGASIAELLTPCAEELLRLVPNATVLFIGRGSDAFRAQFVAAHSRHESRVHSTGRLPPEAVSAHLRACDILVQPFPDGISSRRTSAMAALANGLPVVSNLGDLSEPFWFDGPVAAAQTPDPKSIALLAARLLGDSESRKALGRQAFALYHREFALDNTIARLREASP